jgi:S1-C subfamily serine protease
MRNLFITAAAIFCVILLTGMTVEHNIKANSLQLAGVKHSISQPVTMEDNVSSTVLVLTPFSTGTGFYIAPNYVVTNHHVVSEKKDVHLSRRSLPFKGKVIAVNKDLDIAVIRTEVKGRPVTFYKDEKFKIGRNAFISSLGINAYNYQTFKTGRVMTSDGVYYKENDISRVIITDMLLEPGYSGGPTFDNNNILIGVNVAIGSNYKSKYSYIIPFTIVRDFILSSINNDME